MIIRLTLGVLMGVVLTAPNAFAFKIIENYCNDKATRGTWTVGIKNKKTVKSISAEFSPEFRKIVNFLDKLPIKTSEASLLAGIPAKPAQVIRIMKKHVRFQYEIPGKKSSLAIIVQQHKGCINQISLMESGNVNFYTLSNTLATEP
jgi:hypothetical protein